MTPIGTSRTFQPIRRMSAFEGKVDTEIRVSMSANDPKQTSATPFRHSSLNGYDARPEPGGQT